MRSGVFAVSALGGCGRASGEGALAGSLTASASAFSAMMVSATGSGLTSCLGCGVSVTSVAGTGAGLGSACLTGSGCGLSTGRGVGSGDGFGIAEVCTSRGSASGVAGFSVSLLFSPIRFASGTMSGFFVGVGAGFSLSVAFFSPCCS